MRQIPTKDLRHVEGLNTFFIIPALSDSTVGKSLLHSSTS
jgi:heat shock protein HtpX